MKTSLIRCAGCLQEKSFSWSHEIQSFVCEKCGKPNHKRGDSFQTLPELVLSPTRKPQLPLYSKLQFTSGVLRSCQVIGSAIKSDVNDPTYFWEEYILLGKGSDLYFLCCYDTTWSLLELVNAEIDITKRPPSLFFRKQKYQLDNQLTVKLRYAEGYLPYDFQEIQKGYIHNVEYLDETRIFTIEVHQPSSSYKTFFGNFISAQKMRNALAPLNKEGKIQINDYDYRESRRHVSFWVLAGGFLLTFAICLFLLIYFHTFYPEHVVFDKTIEITNKDAHQPISYTFDIKGNDVSNLHISATHEKDNSWAYLDLTLLNEENDDERNFEIEIEHYSGYEGGEHWSEGQYVVTKNLNEIRSGPYRLTIVADADFQKNNTYSSSTTDDLLEAHSIGLQITYHAHNYHNLWYVFWLWLFAFVCYWIFLQFHEYDLIHYRTTYRIENILWRKFAFIWVLFALSIILVIWGEAYGVEVFHNAAPANGMNMTQQGVHHK